MTISGVSRSGTDMSVGSHAQGCAMLWGEHSESSQGISFPANLEMFKY